MPSKTHKITEQEFEVQRGEEFTWINNTGADVTIEPANAGNWYLEQTIPKGGSVVVKMRMDAPSGAMCECQWISRAPQLVTAAAGAEPSGVGRIIIRDTQAQPLGNGQIIIRVA
jgi:hypothetical protein